MRCLVNREISDAACLLFWKMRREFSDNTLLFYSIMLCVPLQCCVISMIMFDEVLNAQIVVFTNRLSVECRQPKRNDNLRVHSKSPLKFITARITKNPPLTTSSLNISCGLLHVTGEGQIGQEKEKNIDGRIWGNGWIYTAVYNTWEEIGETEWMNESLGLLWESLVLVGFSSQTTTPSQQHKQKKGTGTKKWQSTQKPKNQEVTVPTAEQTKFPYSTHLVLLVI